MPTKYRHRATNTARKAPADLAICTVFQTRHEQAASQETLVVVLLLSRHDRENDRPEQVAPVPRMQVFRSGEGSREAFGRREAAGRDLWLVQRPRPQEQKSRTSGIGRKDFVGGHSQHDCVDIRAGRIVLWDTRMRRTNAIDRRSVDGGRCLSP